MWSLSTIGLVLVSRVASSALPGLPHCGLFNTQADICVNLTKAGLDPYAVYVDLPGYYTFEQCHQTCLESAECKSFGYFVTPGSLFIPNTWDCVQYSQPVSAYQIPCSEGGTSAKLYYDAICPPLIPNFEGEVPDCPNSYCYPAGQATDAIYPNILGGAFGLNNTQCKQLCRKTPGCKSIFWTFYAPDSEQPFGGTNTNPDNVGAPCTLLSQPVKYMIEDTADASSVPLYDLNCPDTEYGYIIKAPYCANGEAPHSSV